MTRDLMSMALKRATGTSDADTAQTVSTPTAGRKRILWVTVAYSAAPTQTGVQIVLNSAEGAAFDTTLIDGTADVQDTYWEPKDEMIIHDGDAIDVTAPAAGGVVTSSIVIQYELAN